MINLYKKMKINEQYASFKNSEMKTIKSPKLEINGA